MNDAPGQSVRAFFALWPEAAERAALAAWQPALRHACGGRAMRGETLHATLVFVGKVDVRQLDVLLRAARETRGRAFDVVWDEARYWAHNRIVYAAPREVPPQLPRLAEGLERNLLAHGVRFDRRPYAPHVTLLRDADSGAVVPPPVPEPVAWHCRSFVLAQSARDAGGAAYRILARFPLG